MRDKLWYLLNDPSGEIAELERRLDRLDIEIDGRRRLASEANRERLERLGVDVSNYKPAPHLHPSELRCTNHLHPDDAAHHRGQAIEARCRLRRVRGCSLSTDQPVSRNGQSIVRRGIGQMLGVR